MDVVVSNFHEGWGRKVGVEEGEKWMRSRTAADDRPVDEKSTNGSSAKPKEERREKRKVESDG